MKTTQKGFITKKEQETLLKDFNELITVYQHKDRKDKLGVIIDPDVKVNDIMFAVHRLNRIVAQTFKLDYELMMKTFMATTEFDDKYGDLDLSEETINKMIEKEKRGF